MLCTDYEFSSHPYRIPFYMDTLTPIPIPIPLQFMQEYVIIKVVVREYLLFLMLIRSIQNLVALITGITFQMQ
jgi:hypothetical protein